MTYTYKIPLDVTLPGKPPTAWDIEISSMVPLTEIDALLDEAVAETAEEAARIGIQPTPRRLLENLEAKVAYSGGNITFSLPRKTIDLRPRTGT